MKGQLRIEEMFAFVVVDTDGTEGIPAAARGPFLVPLTGADLAKVTELLPVAQGLAEDSGKSIEVVHFSERVHVGWVDPPTGPVRPQTAPESEPPPMDSVDQVKAFLALQRPVEADQVVVAALITEGGKPMVVVGFQVDGESLPGIGINRTLAGQMHQLLDEALKAFSRMEN